MSRRDAQRLSQTLVLTLALAGRPMGAQANGSHPRTESDVHGHAVVDMPPDEPGAMHPRQGGPPVSNSCVGDEVRPPECWPREGTGTPRRVTVYGATHPSALDAATELAPGYAASQRRRKLVEEGFA
jgi:hypothetical protein